MCIWKKAGKSFERKNFGQSWDLYSDLDRTTSEKLELFCKYIVFMYKDQLTLNDMIRKGFYMDWSE